MDTSYLDSASRLLNLALDRERRKKERWEQLVKEARATKAKMLEAPIQKSFRAVGDYQRKEIKRVFDQAVAAFYNDESFKPKSYVRTKGLYDVLNLAPYMDATTGYVDDSDPDLLLDHSLPRGRGNKDVGLFDVVFTQGYHGGATHIAPDKAAKWGAHPNPGVPYYRTRGYVTDPDTGKTYLHGFGAWGEPAKKANQSPYDTFVKEFSGGALDSSNDGVLGKKLVSIIEKGTERARKEFGEKTWPKLVKKYFG